MDESPDRKGEVFCPGCGKLNPEGTHFCPACGAPLTSHATTDPLGSVFAEGYAARRALSQPSKPIIVVGVWAWMFPMAFLSAVGLIYAIVSFVYGVFTHDLDPVIHALLAALPSAVVFYIAVTLLYRVTKKARQAKAEESDPANQATDADNEPIICLTCGQSIPAGATQCPACGWSYTDGA